MHRAPTARRVAVEQVTLAPSSGRRPVVGAVVDLPPMTAANDPTVQEYERRAEDYEHSPLLVLLKVARVVVWIVYAFALVTGVLLTTAFFLHLAGANPEASFVEWVYRSTDRAMRPFRGIFPTQDVGGASVLDFSYLVAAIVYFVIALVVDGAHRWLTGRIRRQQWEAGRARAQADMAAQHVVDQQHVDERSAQQAAAREYAAQQAAAQQYAIARAAAQEALAQQRPPVGAERPQPPASGV
jgi:uncharacterized protein YggT (Ycf19 family)